MNVVRRVSTFFILIFLVAGIARGELYKVYFKKSVSYLELERGGCEPIYYLGNGKWLIQNSAKVDRGLLSSAQKIQPQDKLSFSLVRGVPSFAVERGRAHLLVYFNSRKSYNEVVSFITQRAEIIRFDERWWSAEIYIPSGKISELAASDMVVYMEPSGAPIGLMNDSVRETVKANWSQEYLGLKGDKVVVGIWDGGWVDKSHPDFSGRVELGDNSHTDSHATHVAGTIASSGAQSETCGDEPREWRGIVPVAKIISYDFNNSTMEYPDAASKYHINIANNSWGILVSEGSQTCDMLGYYDDLARSFDSFVRDHNMVIVFAAGNMRTSYECGIPERGGYDSITPPATGKNVLTAGAINSVTESMTTFSSWGPTDDGRVKPDFVTPGCDDDGKGYINSTLPGGCYGGYGWCGTSMASPALTGCAAAVIESYKDTNHRSPLPSTVRAALVHTAKDLGAPGPDYSFGFGRPDIMRSANLIKWGAVVESELSSPTSEKTWDIEVDSDYPLKITLAWDDYPADPGAEVALVNDLELRAISPSSTTYSPFVLNPDNPWINAASGENHTDNVEQILVENPEGGKWRIVVNAYAMPYPPQSFSVACEFLALKNCDADRDGFLSGACGGNDCDDNDSLVNPAAIENCYDSKDNDCDGEVNEGCGGDDDIDVTDDDNSGGPDRAGRGCGLP